MAALRQVYPNAMSVVYKNNIILLINQDTPVQLSPKLTGPLEQFAERNHLKVSLSQPFADILKSGFSTIRHSTPLSCQTCRRRIRHCFTAPMPCRNICFPNVITRSWKLGSIIIFSSCRIMIKHTIQILWKRCGPIWIMTGMRQKRQNICIFTGALSSIG